MESLSLSPGHRRHVGRQVRQQWFLFAVAVLAWGLEVGLGWHIWSQVRSIGIPAAGEGGAWSLALGALAVLQGVGTWLWRRRLLDPERVSSRLAHAWQEAGGTLPVPGEVATVAACRTVFVADAIAWMLWQTIAIYGLVAMMLEVRSGPLIGFAALALLLLLLAAPRRGRMLSLAAALQPRAP